MNSNSNGTMGTLADKVSSPEELLNGDVVAAAGSPSHTPQRACQLYINATTGAVWYWFSGSWTAL